LCFIYGFVGAREEA